MVLTEKRTYTLAGLIKVDHASKTAIYDATVSCMLVPVDQNAVGGRLRNLTQTLALVLVNVHPHQKAGHQQFNILQCKEICLIASQRHVCTMLC